MSATPVRQIAYFVEDVGSAAAAHHARFGSGPYFLAEHIPLRRVLHRGRDSALDHTSAYGQWGALMIEFVQQNDSGPSAFHDIYPPGSGLHGLHHVAVFVDDIHASIASYEAAGYATALYAEMNDGFEFAMIDQVRDLGHMVELYEAKPILSEFYAFVAGAAGDFRDRPLIRPITFD